MRESTLRKARREELIRGSRKRGGKRGGTFRFTRAGAITIFPVRDFDPGGEGGREEREREKGRFRQLFAGNAREARVSPRH